MFFVGLAHIAFLPSFEGVDETAHWSYVEELASTGHSPVYGRDHLAGDLAAYGGPSRYGDAPPYERTGRATYRSYRLSGAPPIAGGPGRYAQGVELNWQAQHPPLYYALLAPVWLATKGMGWKASLFSLRLASWVMAVTSCSPSWRSRMMSITCSLALTVLSLKPM